MRRRRRMIESLDLDFEDHIRRETEDNISRGMQPDEARSAALRSFGNVARLKEDVREVWSVIWLEHALQDLRYALSVLKKNPGFTAAAILTLALGTGMNTAVFSVVNAVLLQPLPYPEPGRLIWISHNCRYSSGDCLTPRSDYEMYREQARSFESMALIGNEDLALVYRGEAGTERVGFLEGEFWNITGAKPAFGRLFGPGEPDTAVLTWSLFERRFGSDAGVIGKSIAIEGHAYTIVGVLPETFRHLFPQALSTGDEVRDMDAYVPTPVGHEAPGDPVKANPKLGPAPPWFRVVGKLKPNVSFERAHAGMKVIYGRMLRQYPNPYSHSANTQELRFETVEERLVGHTRPTLLILSGAAGFVLLIAAANIANLLLARASTREREIAIRTALGAGRMRVIRQFLAESVLLALLGGAAGVALAQFSLGLVARFGSGAVPRLSESRIDASVLLFALAISFITGILFGLAPALTLARRDPDEILRRDARTSTASAGQLRVRSLLVAGEVAMAMVLLIGAGLMLKSFWQMSSYPPGLKPGKILTMRISLSGPQYDRNWPRQNGYLQQLFTQLRALPGVQEFGIDCGRFTQPVKIAGAPGNSAQGPLAAAIRYVSPGYLRAVGMPLLQGRWPGEDEMFDAALVNEKLAHEISAPQIVGRRIQGSFFGATVAGVVADFKDWQLDAEPSPEAYTAYATAPVIRSVRVVIRTSIDPQSIAPAVRKLISGIDKDVPVFQLQTLEQELSNSIAPRRFNMALLAAFAATAVLLASIGIYGVIAYLAVQRTPEIGIRMALGANPSEIVRMVMSQGMAMALAGILAGLIASMALTRLMAAMLYRVDPGDPGTFASVAVLLILTALLACCLPARKAARIDPLAALRHE